MKSFRTVAAALSLGSTAYAAVNQKCATSDVCYSLSIPESTANSGNGDIFFQLSAPTSYEWVALGQGSGMTGSNIFVMYTSSDGNNVTVSPRLGKGEFMPQHDNSAKITVLDGSGVENGMMTANVQCSNCESWSGGDMDFTSSSASWIYAYKSGSSLNSDDLDATINQHDSASAFTWAISQAKGGSDANPFVSSGSNNNNNNNNNNGNNNGGATGAASSSAPAATSSYTVSGTAIPGTCTPVASSASASGAASATGSITSSTGVDDACPTTRPTGRHTWPASCFTAYATGRGGRPYPTGALKVKRDDGCPAGYASTSNSISSGDLIGSDDSASQNAMLLAHGVIACLAFVAVFPIGGILIRIANFSGLLWIHAGLQLSGYLLYVIAFAMGVYMATHLDKMNNAHPIIGIALFVVLLLQPIFGILHHKLFKKYGHRTLWSYFHIWHGRAAILLGMVNGGLGIQLAGNSSMPSTIAYAVIAGLMGVVYIVCIIFGERKRKNKPQPPSYEKSQRGQRRQSHQLRDLSSSEENVQHHGYYSKDGQRI